MSPRPEPAGPSLAVQRPRRGHGGWQRWSSGTHHPHTSAPLIYTSVDGAEGGSVGMHFNNFLTGVFGGKLEREGLIDGLPAPPARRLDAAEHQRPCWPARPRRQAQPAPVPSANRGWAKGRRMRW